MKGVCGSHTTPQYLAHDPMRCRVAGDLPGHAVDPIRTGAMAHTVQSKKKLIARVRRIRGQADALERALDQETECGAILQQIAAIRGAVNGLMAEVLEGHIREHLGAEALPPEQRVQEVDQVVVALRSYLR